MLYLAIIIIAFTALVSWDVIKGDDTPGPDHS